jgi:hypothetical protein
MWAMRLLALFLLTAEALAGLQDGRLTLVTVTGTGLVMPANKAAQVGLVFEPASTLSTGEKSGATVFLSNGTKLILSEEAVVHFKVLKQMEGEALIPDAEATPTKEKGPSVTEVEVEKGKVVGDVKKLAHQSSFTLKTPVGTVRIKGTVFSVEYRVSKEGIATFNVGCARGLVQVEVAGSKAGPMAIKGGQQLSMSAPAPKPAQQAAPEQKGEEKKGEAKEKPADKPAPKDDAPPPAPEMKIEPLKADTFANIPNFSPPPPPPPAAAPPPQPGASPATLDNMIQRVQDTVNREQLNPSPTGG